MPRLPRVSGKETIRALQRAWFVVFDQEGSHVYLHRRLGDRFTHRVTVPAHGPANSQAQDPQIDPQGFRPDRI